MTQTIRRSDKELQTTVTEELSYNPSIDAAHLVVLANDGVVTLSGDVASLPEQHAAKRAVLRVWGVKAVADDMVVREPGASGTKDSEIAEAAAQMLKWTVDVPSDMVEAGVRNHTITLSGTVNWQYQREAAARAVMYIKDVTAVTNTISLTATAPASGRRPRSTRRSCAMPSSTPARSMSTSCTKAAWQKPARTANSLPSKACTPTGTSYKSSDTPTTSERTRTTTCSPARKIGSWSVELKPADGLRRRDLLIASGHVMHGPDVLRAQLLDRGMRGHQRRVVT